MIQVFLNLVLLSWQLSIGESLEDLDQAQNILFWTEVLQKFSLELSEKMANMDSNLEVPEHYIENELKDYLNRNFEVNPEIPLKD